MKDKFIWEDKIVNLKKEISGLNIKSIVTLIILTLFYICLVYLGLSLGNSLKLVLIYSIPFLLTILFVGFFVYFFNSFIKRQKPVRIINEGIILTKFINQLLIKKNEIMGVELGKYGKIGKLRKTSKFLAGTIYFLSFFSKHGQIDRDRYKNLLEFQEKYITIIKTKDKEYSLVINEVDGFKKACKKIGLKIKESEEEVVGFNLN